MKLVWLGGIAFVVSVFGGWLYKTDSTASNPAKPSIDKRVISPPSALPFETKVVTPKKPFPVEPPDIRPAKNTDPLFDGSTEGFAKLDAVTEETLISARNLVSQGKAESASVLLEKSFQQTPENEYLGIELALLNSRLLKNPQRAQEILTQLTKQKPSSKMAAAAMGDLLMEQNRPAEATPYLEKAAEGESLIEARLRLADNWMVRGEPAKALEIFDQAYEASLQAEPSENSEQLAALRALDRGFALKDLGRTAEALEMLKEAESARGAQDPGVKALRQALQ